MLEPATSSLLGLRDYVRVVSRRRTPILLAMIVVVVVALASALVQTPVYGATASILLRPSANANVLNPAAAAPDPAQELQSDIEIITSQPIKQAVQAQLGSAPHITVSPHGQAAGIDISARSTDARSAAIIANAYASAFIKYQQTESLNSALAAESQIQMRITDLQSQINAVNKQIESATPAIVNATLAPRVASLEQQQGAFRQQLSQIQLQAAVNSQSAKLVSPATKPTSPITPKPIRDVLLAGVAGLMLGVGAALALEYFDDSIKSREDLERAVGGIPNIGLIPRVQGWKDRDRPVLVTLTDPGSPAAEAYRSLRTSLQFVSLDRSLRIILVTSPSAGEGKTTIVSNLGVALAKLGRRVVIVGCDLRRPRLHQFFGVGNSVGFTSAVLGEQSVLAALQRVPQEPNLSILASGPVPPNPSELLSSKRAREVLSAVEGKADIILIDSPPLLPVTDAAILTRFVDATLLVVTVGSTTRKQVAQALEVLRQVDAPLIGTILNNVSPDAAYDYAYEPSRPGGDPVRPLPPAGPSRRDRSVPAAGER